MYIQSILFFPLIHNNILDELNIIKPEQIETKQDLKDALNNIPDITSILNKYEEDLKI
jgi:hypothetical protein